MSNIELPIKITPGTKFIDAVIEARQKAIDWNVGAVSFTFNGVEIYITQNSTIDDVLEMMAMEYDKDNQKLLNINLEY